MDAIRLLRVNDVEVLSGDAAKTLHKQILDKVSKHAKKTGYDHKATVSSFKAGTRSYGQGDLSADEFVKKLVNLFDCDGAFTGSIVKQLAQLLADDQKRTAFIVAADPLLQLSEEEPAQTPLPSEKKENEDIQTIFIDIDGDDPQMAVMTAAEKALDYDKAAMKVFKKQARAYIGGELEAEAYTAYLCKTFGNKNTMALLPALARLVPSVKLRGQLIQSGSGIGMPSASARRRSRSGSTGQRGDDHSERGSEASAPRSSLVSEDDGADVENRPRKSSSSRRRSSTKSTDGASPKVKTNKSTRRRSSGGSSMGGSFGAALPEGWASAMDGDGQVGVCVYMFAPSPLFCFSPLSLSFRQNLSLPWLPCLFDSRGSLP